ncbi:MAG: hypothetical protein ACYSR6_07210 [Planctomycetota bacterium]|jgi:hypothetical protein
MKSKLKVIVALIVIAGCLSWAAFNISRKRSSSWNKTRYLAAMTQLNDAVREGLQGYYHTNGRYPDKLSEVAVDLPKGAEAEMLDKFSYTSRGQLSVVSWGVEWGDGPVQEHTEHAAKGKVVFVEEYVDEELCSRTEYPNGYEEPDTRVEKEYRYGELLTTREYRNGQKISEETHGSW